MPDCFMAYYKLFIFEYQTEYFIEKECSGWYDMHIDNSVKVWDDLLCKS